MTSHNYLEELLASQRLDEHSDEWKALEEEVERIEGILRAAYPRSALTFTHAGSRAKRTMIREDYDLDEVAYFRNEDKSAGENSCRDLRERSESDEQALLSAPQAIRAAAGNEGRPRSQG